MSDSLYPEMISKKEYDALQKRLDEALGRVSQLSRQLTQKDADFIQAVWDFPEGCEAEKKNFLKSCGLLETQMYSYSVSIEYSTDQEITEEDAEELEEILANHIDYKVGDFNLDTEDGFCVNFQNTDISVEKDW